MKNLPKTIYLITGMDKEGAHWMDFRELFEVSWSDEKLHGGDVGPYIRLDWFLSEVNRMAEDRMLKTGVLEGAHYNAMKSLAKSLTT